MKKLIALVSAFAIIFSLSACGQKLDGDNMENTAANETTTLALPDPAAIVNPEEMDWGWNENRAEPFENNTSDIWYPVSKGENATDYMYFVNGHSIYKVENGEEKSSGWIRGEDNHMLVDTEYATFEFDIVFMDNFTLYDYISETYYTRGDQYQYTNLFVGKAFTCKTDETRIITLKEDGKGDFAYKGESEEITWEVIAQRIIRVAFSDGYDTEYYVFYNADGSVNFISESPYKVDNAFYPG